MINLNYRDYGGTGIRTTLKLGGSYPGLNFALLSRL